MGYKTNLAPPPTKEERRERVNAKQVKTNERNQDEEKQRNACAVALFRDTYGWTALPLHEEPPPA